MNLERLVSDISKYLDKNVSREFALFVGVIFLLWIIPGALLAVYLWVVAGIVVRRLFADYPEVGNFMLGIIAQPLKLIGFGSRRQRIAVTEEVQAVSRPAINIAAPASNGHNAAAAINITHHDLAMARLDGLRMLGATQSALVEMVTNPKSPLYIDGIFKWVQQVVSDLDLEEQLYEWLLTYHFVDFNPVLVRISGGPATKYELNEYRAAFKQLLIQFYVESRPPLAQLAAQNIMYRDPNAVFGKIDTIIAANNIAG